MSTVAELAKLRAIAGDISRLAFEAEHLARSAPHLDVKPEHFRAVMASMGKAVLELELARHALPIEEIDEKTTMLKPEYAKRPAPHETAAPAGEGELELYSGPAVLGIGLVLGLVLGLVVGAVLFAGGVLS